MQPASERQRDELGDEFVLISGLNPLTKVTKWNNSRLAAMVENLLGWSKGELVRMIASTG